MTTLPAALLPALRLVWSRTLFPGASAVGDRPRYSALILLLILPALLLYSRLDFHLLEPDEGRYAEIPREMLARGEWVVPLLQGEPYLDKPPLLYWLVMLSYTAFGPSAAAARLVPALAVHATILATYMFGCAFVGERSARRAALLLAVMPGLIGIGRLLTLDGLLSLWVALGLFAGFQWLRSGRGGWLFAIACGLGVLTKGPIALVLVGVPLVGWKWFHTGATRQFTVKHVAMIVAIIAAINLPWYALMIWRQPGFLRYFFWQHNVERFLNPFDHLEPIWYYGPILFACLLPGSLFVVPILRNFVGGDPARVARRSPELAFCLLSGGWCVLFFSLSGCKLPTYILPAIAPLALALGVLLDGVRYQGPVMVGWLAVVAVTQLGVLPWYARERSPFREEAIVREVCSDPATAVVCYPRNCDSLAFYLGRDDLKSTRSKHVHLLIGDLRTRDRTVVLFTHRHSLVALGEALPNDLTMSQVADFRQKRRGIAAQLVGDVPWGLCDIGVVERQPVN